MTFNTVYSFKCRRREGREKRGKREEREERREGREERGKRGERRERYTCYIKKGSRLIYYNVMKDSGRKTK